MARRRPRRAVGRRGRPTSPPRLFRILLPAKDLAVARRFYETLFGTGGRKVAEGRIYFDVGPVLLGIVDHSARPAAEWGRPSEAIYFATTELEELHRRAAKLGCLSKELLHDDPASPMGELVRRPWGERSFYAEDPSGNPLCFVDERTLFTGTIAQVRRLRGPSLRGPRSPPA